MRSRREFPQAAPAALAGAGPERREFDVLIWDSTPAGITAAIAASRGGLRTAIVTATPWHANCGQKGSRPVRDDSGTEVLGNSRRLDV